MTDLDIRLIYLGLTAVSVSCLLILPAVDARRYFELVRLVCVFVRLLFLSIDLRMRDSSWSTTANLSTSL